MEIERGGVHGPADRHLIVPQLAKELRDHPLIQAVRITTIGYFSRSTDHHRARQHGAPEWVVMLVLAGTGWSRLQGRLRHHAPGSLVVLPPDQPHEYGSNPKDPWTIAWVHLAGSAVFLDRAPGQLSTLRLLRAAELVDEAYAVLQRQSSDQDHHLVSGIAAHLQTLLQQPDQADDAMARLVRHLREHLLMRLIYQRLRIEPVIRSANSWFVFVSVSARRRSTGSRVNA